MIVLSPCSRICPQYVLESVPVIWLMDKHACTHHFEYDRDLTPTIPILTHWDQDKMATIFPDDIFICIFLNENIWMPIKISLKFVLKGVINNIPTMVQIMDWRRPGHYLNQ